MFFLDCNPKLLFFFWIVIQNYYTFVLELKGNDS